MERKDGSHSGRVDARKRATRRREIFDGCSVEELEWVGGTDYAGFHPGRATVYDGITRRGAILDCRVEPLEEV